ncbi:hypothetical protein PAXRUDRAFT_97235, partial [Paxillus rubicundulus Ve08.2h10]
EEEWRSLCMICHAAEEELCQKKKHVKLSHTTLLQRLNGSRSFQRANEENNGWFTTEEEEKIVKYCLELAVRAFLLMHRHLKLHVDSILQGWHCKDFPTSGVGVNWKDHFLNHHMNCLGTYWSSSLNTACGQAVNKHTHEAWFNLLMQTINKYNI